MVFSLFLVACGGGSDEAVEEVEAVEEPAETLDSPATTAAAAEPEADRRRGQLLVQLLGARRKG